VGGVQEACDDVLANPTGSQTIASAYNITLFTISRLGQEDDGVSTLHRSISGRFRRQPGLVFATFRSAKDFLRVKIASSGTAHMILSTSTRIEC
jgi:hypothetical protein